jgi:hypothetical protein
MGEKKARVNFYLTEVQVKRMEELMDLHGYPNLNQCAKYLMQRGMSIECNQSGIIHTNAQLEEMVGILRDDVASISSTATESQVCENTIPLELGEEAK